VINEKNFLQTALHSYDNVQCLTLDEFQEDVNRFSHIKKILSRYVEGAGVLNERLLLNHLVILFNVFGNKATDLLLFKIDSKYYGALFPFLILLNRLPEDVYQVYPDVQLDNKVIQTLRQI
jgi:hypothetical protein